MHLCLLRSSRYQSKEPSSFSLLPPRQASMFLSCLTVLTLINFTWVMAEQRSWSSRTCKLLQQEMGLSDEQHQICLGEGGRELLLAVGDAQASDFPDNCRYWMMDERWNCDNVSLPAFQSSVQTQNHWIHKCELVTV